MTYESCDGGKKNLSGADNRKREKQKEAAESELLKKVPKLNTYFSAPQASAASRTSATLEQSEEAQGITIEGSFLVAKNDYQNIPVLIPTL